MSKEPVVARLELCKALITDVLKQARPAGLITGVQICRSVTAKVCLDSTLYQVHMDTRHAVMALPR